MRILAVVPVLASFTVIGSAARVGPSVASCAQAASVHHAALVVEHGDGSVRPVCVAFSEDSITGDQLLSRSGVEYATADYGGSGKAVCQIDGEPTSYPPGCWTASSKYWAMFVSRAGGSWTTSSLGISSQTFRDGDAEGFRYEGQSDYSVPPSPRGVCRPAASPTPIPAATANPSLRVTTQSPPPSSSGPSPTPAANTASAPSPTASEPASSDPASSATARATVTIAGTTPTAQPPFLSAGAWAASGLGVVLLVLLVVQVVRPRRRPSPPPGLP